MDFKYTAPGSKEQVRAMTTLSFLMGMWADFLSAEERGVDRAQAFEANRLQRDAGQPTQENHKTACNETPGLQKGVGGVLLRRITIRRTPRFWACRRA